MWKSETTYILSDLKSPSKKNKAKLKKTVQNILNITKERIDQTLKDHMNEQLKNYREKYKNWMSELIEFNKKKETVYDNTKYSQESEEMKKDSIDKLKEEEMNIVFKRPILNFLPKSSQLREMILLTANDERSPK